MSKASSIFGGELMTKNTDGAMAAVNEADKASDGSESDEYDHVFEEPGNR